MEEMCPCRVSVWCVLKLLWDTISQGMLYHLKSDNWKDNSLYIMKTAGDYQVYLAFSLVFYV